MEKKPLCKYRDKCYRKNPQHLSEYRHRSDEETEDPNTKQLEEQNTGKKEVEKLSVKTNESDIVQQKDTAARKQENKKRSLINEYFSKKDEDRRATKRVKMANDDSCSKESVADAEANDKQPEAAVSDDHQALDDADPPTEIKNKFLVDMPKDFYDFWQFAVDINASKPSEAFASSLGLHLVGPYDVLAAKTQHLKHQPNYLCHWRYYFDPPEFLTVLRGDDKTQFHIGYYRDDPKEMPAYVGWNEAAENCNIKSCGDNIFAAISWFIEDIMKKKGKLVELAQLLKRVKSFANQNGFSLDKQTPAMKAREKKLVSKCFHGGGILVPVDKSGVGYRPLPETPAGLRKILHRIVDSKTKEEHDRHFDSLSEILTFVQFANDECDYGQGLELGLDIFCFGESELHPTVLALLPLAYRLLHRDEYAQIIEAHLADRRRSPVSTLNRLVVSERSN